MRELRLGFDLDQPARVEQGGHDDHGGGGPDGAEELAVHRTDGVGMLGRRHVHACAHDVVQRRAGLAQGAPHDLEAAAGLGPGVVRALPVGKTGPVPETRTPVADPDGPAEADGGLEG